MTLDDTTNDFETQATGTGEGVFFMKNLPKQMNRVQALRFAARIVALMDPEVADWERCLSLHVNAVKPKPKKR